METWKHSREWLPQEWSHLSNGMAQWLEFLFNELALGIPLQWSCSRDGSVPLWIYSKKWNRFKEFPKAVSLESSLGDFEADTLLQQV